MGWFLLVHLRLDPKNNDQPWSQEVQKQWMNVDLYIGGAEHAVLHLLYSRCGTRCFMICYKHKAFQKLRHQAQSLAQPIRTVMVATMKFLKWIRDNKPYLKSTGELLTTQIEKMANPNSIVNLMMC